MVDLALEDEETSFQTNSWCMTKQAVGLYSLAGDASDSLGESTNLKVTYSVSPSALKRFGGPSASASIKPACVAAEQGNVGKSMPCSAFVCMD